MSRLSSHPVSLAFVIGGAAFVLLLLLACGGVQPTAGLNSPRWACPSPTPKPYGEAGPVKDTQVYSSDGKLVTDTLYYEPWEQEYGGTFNGPPFPTPTPYGIVGSSYSLGQRVDLGISHVQVEAHPGAPVPDQTDATGTSYQLFFVDITWDNHGSDAIPFAYGAQVKLQAITQPNGAIRTDSGWTTSLAAFSLANIASPPAAIPPGNSTATVPIIAPAGAPRTVVIQFIGLGAQDHQNPDLRQQGMSITSITWDAAPIAVGPPCADAGAYTPWQNGTAIAWGHEVPIGIAAPAGAPRVVEIALAQVGKPYRLGSKGPDIFDCSGLMTWSYAQIGISIPHGTGRAGPGGQWYTMKAVSVQDLQPGDLVFFNWEHDAAVDHVGMVADLDKDGTWDLIHAASPSLGVRVDANFLASRYYGPTTIGFRTAR